MNLGRLLQFTVKLSIQITRRIVRTSIKHLALLVICFFTPLAVAAQGLNTATLDQVFGSEARDVYKFGFPRTDLRVTLHGVAVEPGLALGSWAAFTGSEDNATVMGDFVLLQDEVGSVMSKLQEKEFEITAVHNHLLDETPHVMYMHYMGHGKADELGASLKAALATSKTPLGKPASGAKAAAEPAFAKAVEEALGHKGSFNGGVLAIGVPRAEAIMMGGMTVPPSMGVAESLNFQEAGAGKVATTGDFVLTAEEVNPVMSALLEHGIRVRIPDCLGNTAMVLPHDPGLLNAHRRIGARRNAQESRHHRPSRSSRQAIRLPHDRL